VTASVWDAGRYAEGLDKLYTALSFTGLKLGFITERQLESGLLPPAPVVFVPRVTHFSTAALATLRKYSGRLVFVGDENLLSRDEYDRPVSPALKGEILPMPAGPLSARGVRGQILAQMPAWNLRPAVQLQDASGQPAWGVEWRSADTRQGLVVNLCNYLKEPQTVTLLRAEKPIAGQDVLTGQQVAGTVTLAPLEVRLVRGK
jgi:hypothetical protein